MQCIIVTTCSHLPTKHFTQQLGGNRSSWSLINAEGLYVHPLTMRAQHHDHPYIHTTTHTYFISTDILWLGFYLSVLAVGQPVSSYMPRMRAHVQTQGFLSSPLIALQIQSPWKRRGRGRAWCWLPDTFCPMGHQLSATLHVRMGVWCVCIFSHRWLIWLSGWWTWLALALKSRYSNLTHCMVFVLVCVFVCVYVCLCSLARSSLVFMAAPYPLPKLSGSVC